MDKKTADKAAQWWANQLQKGGDDMGDDMGDDSPQAGFTMALGTMLQSKCRAKNTPEKLESFKNHLSDHLQKQDDLYRLYVGCDYGPDAQLAKAAELAGIDTGAFPWKTGMVIEGDVIRVAEGYAAPWKLL